MTGRSLDRWLEARAGGLKKNIDLITDPAISSDPKPDQGRLGFLEQAAVRERTQTCCKANCESAGFLQC
jgi:hypothetical protein